MIRGACGDYAERPLDIRGDRLDLAGGIGGRRIEHILRLTRAVQNRGRGVGPDRRQCTFDIDRQRLDVVGGV